MTATAQAPAQQQSRHAVQQGDNFAGFLQYARTKKYPLAGTIPTGAVGGTPASNVAFSDSMPVVPAWAKAVVWEITVPIALVVPAGATATISPYFPYNLLTSGLTLAGSPPWDPITMTPWWLDEITDTRNFDPAMTGLPTGAPANQADPGAFAFSVAGFTPGGTIVNGGGSPATTNGTVTFRVKQRLQRNPKLMFGCFPMGDPENRPKITAQLSALVGPSPENNPFQDIAAAGITASLSGPATINVVVEGLSLDIVPDGVPTIPNPVCGMGLAVTYATITQQAAGQFLKAKHNAAMLYEKVLHLLVNAQAALRSDYFGNWLTGEQQSARWEYDATQGTLNDYYEDIIKRYRRYLPRGVYVADLFNGANPDNPAQSVYQAAQTPDSAYAAEFELAATPAWTTVLRPPVGTAMNNCYAALYEFGLVNVPY